MNLKPLGNRIVVSRVKEETTTAGGIIIPDNAVEKPSTGIVEFIGNGSVTPEGERLLMEVEVGDKVLFGKYSGSEVKFDGQTFVIMSESDVLAIIEEEVTNG